nr:PREDICTED: coilin-like isoform X3 [Musa acuminata subsp. malaccensis]
MAEPMRVRVEFEDHRRLLTKSQRKDGLHRCWILLGPHLPTVADLAAHLARSFALHRSCPRGICLYMDEFVLPPFESTSIFRDKDIIRVRKKACKQRQLLGTYLPVNSRTNKRNKGEGSCDFQQNTTNIHAILSEETNLKKKEHMNKTRMLKRRKLNPSNTEKPIITAEPNENVLFEKNEHFVQKRSSLRRILNRKDGTSDGDGRCDSLISNRLHQAHANYCRSQPESHANGKAEQSEYPLLVDVGLLKAISTSDMQSDGNKMAAPANNWEVAVSVASAKESSTHVTVVANTKISCLVEPMPNSDWGQMQQCLSERMKTRLQENRWDCWIANKISATPWPWAVSGRGAVGTADGSFRGKWRNRAPAKYVTNLKSSKS